MSPLDLTFTTASILPLLAHAKAATRHEPTYGQLFEGRFRKDGRNIPVEADEHVDRDDVDLSLVPAGLWLVKDDGAYLMSNGRPGLFKPGSATSHAVVYARHYGKGCEHIGGDDFTDFLAIETFEAIVASGAREFTIRVTEEDISIFH